MKIPVQVGTTLGPYSPGLQVNVGTGKILFVSGQIGIEPESGNLVSPDFGRQTEQVFKNIRAVLHKAGYELGDIVKLTIYLTDLKNFAAVNESCKAYFNEPFPARATVQVAALPKEALIEIDAIAVHD